MALSVALNKKITNFLISLPNVNDSSGRQTLIHRAMLDTQLYSQIRFSEPSAHFFELLIPLLVKYGQLEDGRNALEAVLESAKNFVGQTGREHCESLLQQLRAVSNGEEYLPCPLTRLSVQLLLEGPPKNFNETKRQDLTNVIAALLDIETKRVRILCVNQ